MLQRLEVLHWRRYSRLQLMTPTYKGSYRWTVVVGIESIAISNELHLLVVYSLADCHLIIEHAHNFCITLSEFLLDLWTIENAAHNTYKLRNKQYISINNNFQCAENY